MSNQHQIVNDRGEMWPCLLEKAYAKLHGSYDHLSGGVSSTDFDACSMCFTSQFPVEATVDFTGGFPEAYIGPGYGALQGLNTDLYAEMKRALEESPGVLITTCSLIQEYRWNLHVKLNAQRFVLGTWGLLEAMPTQCWDFWGRRRSGQSCLAWSRSGIPGATPLSGG